jgi:hypothetical protein
MRVLIALAAQSMISLSVRGGVFGRALFGIIP